MHVKWSGVTMRDATTQPDMSVNIGGLIMKNPVTVASGTFGYGPEYAELVDLNQLGAMVVKGIMPDSWEGNQTPRLIHTDGGLINAIGLPGPGVEGFIESYVPFLRQYDVPVIVNVWGRSLEEYGAVAERLSDVEGVHALELNISCPNIKKGGNQFGTDASMTADLISLVRSRTKLPIIPKLAPNVSDIRLFARVCEESGSDAISMINSMPAMAIDIETRRPILANKVGGLTGPAVHAIAVKLIWEAASVITIPIIGMGGIMNGDDAIEMMIAGASAVAVGTANFIDPSTPIRVIQEIQDYLVRHNYSSAKDLVGSVVI
jgi:dihydroorotate dehydrogenase (NAD+) catalytic subunit